MAPPSWLELSLLLLVLRPELEVELEVELDLVLELELELELELMVVQQVAPLQAGAHHPYQMRQRMTHLCMCTSYDEKMLGVK